MRTSDSPNHRGNVAIKVKKTRRRHRFPIVANRCCGFLFGLEALQWQEIQFGMFLLQHLELPCSTRSFFESLSCATRQETTFQNRQQNMKKAFLRIDIVRGRILTKGLIELNLKQHSMGEQSLRSCLSNRFDVSFPVVQVSFRFLGTSACGLVEDDTADSSVITCKYSDVISTDSSVQV